MSTRGFLGFVAEGCEVITYNHFSSDPGGLGLDVLAWLRSANLDIAAKVAPNVRVVSDDIPPTDDDIEALAPSHNRGVDQERSRGTGRPTWYQLTRGNQGDLGAILRAGYTETVPLYPCGAPGCEYGYLVDFDTRVFEAYEGHQREPHHNGRFAGRRAADASLWPVRLVASWPLDGLPDDDAFLRAMDGDGSKEN